MRPFTAPAGPNGTFFAHIPERNPLNNDHKTPTDAARPNTDHPVDESLSGPNGDGDTRSVESMTRVVLRPLASPLPLAFFAFGIGSLLLGGQQLGLIPPDETKVVALMLGAFVFPLQAVAAVFAFLARETLGATAIALISASWLANALVSYTLPPGTPTATMGLFQLSLAVVLLLLGAVGISGKPLLAAVILVASIRYGLDGVYELTGVAPLEIASGVLGLVVFLFALYGGLALGLEDVKHRTVLPFGRRGEARDAIEGDLADQIGPIEHEAGVRKQL